MVPWIMANYKKRLPPIDPFDVWTIEILAAQAARIRGQHDSTHPYYKVREELKKELRYLTEDRGYTPAQIAEETSLSYRSVKRYLQP